MKNKKVKVFLGGILLFVLVGIGISYAIWQITLKQTDRNVLKSACFQVEFQDKNPISLVDAYPMKEEDVDSLMPYTFTITNTCTTAANYQINLEVLNASTLRDFSYIDVRLNQNPAQIIGTLPVVEKTLDEAITSYKLETNYLAPNESRTFDLRMWMDYQAPVLPSLMNQVFQSRVTIINTYTNETQKSSGTLRYVNRNTNDGMWAYRDTIKKVVIQDRLNPILGAISYDESETKDGSVMSYVVENDDSSHTVYLQSNNKLYLSSNSSYIFYNFQNLEEIVGMEFVDSSNTVLMNFMFSNCSNLKYLDLSHFDTSKVVHMESMFSNCSGLTNLDVSHFNTSELVNMKMLFSNCSNLTHLDLSNFVTDKVMDMTGLFYGMTNLKNIDILHFNTGKLTNMWGMFYGCSSLESVNLTNLNLENVTNMSNLFYRCLNLKSVDFTDTDTSFVEDMSYMFYQCTSLENLDLSWIATSSVTNMMNMFALCTNLKTLDISYFETENVTDMRGMFQECKNLTTINYGDYFVCANDADVSFMYRNCPANKPNDSSWNGVTF